MTAPTTASTTAPTTTSTTAPTTPSTTAPTGLTPTSDPELTLDPENWDHLRTLGHRMVDDMLDHLQTLRDQPAWQPLPPAIAKSIRADPLPQAPLPAEQVYAQFREQILPYTNGNRHPRAWGWVRGTGTPLAMLADMLASGINAHMAGGAQAPVLIEEQVLAWLAEAMGLPFQTSGLLTSGGSMANLLGLAIGRHTKAGFDVRKEGLQHGRPELLVYGSTETHSWARKSMELFGMGASFRTIPVDQNYQIDLGLLQIQLATDLQAGCRPVAIIANCGTVNTGAIDDLTTLARICREHDLWLHVDGAFGALLQLTPAYRHLVAGLEQADSLAFDLHKWMYLPFEIGCLLVRDPLAHTAAFAARASYLEDAAGGIMAGGLPFADRGIELTRSFKALKLWMSLKTYGIERHARLIEQNVRQCEHLERLIAGQPRLELLAPRNINIVCFRYRPEPGTMDEEMLNRLNRQLVIALQESGGYVVSGTTLDERYSIRVANTNHRSTLADFDAFVADTLRTGRALAESFTLATAGSA